MNDMGTVKNTDDDSLDSKGMRTILLIMIGAVMTVAVIMVTVMSSIYTAEPIEDDNGMTSYYYVPEAIDLIDDAANSASVDGIKDWYVANLGEVAEVTDYGPIVHKYGHGPFSVYTVNGKVFASKLRAENQTHLPR